MAFTEQNKSDAYLFFALAFNAAPGSVYGGQIVEAYNAGMTTQQIVNVYTTKEQFTKLYPTTLTNKEFATALVNNVSAAATSAAVKAKAVTDIEAALTAGLTKGDVIFNVLGNLAKLDVTNADWGATVAQINNKVTVAKVLTEGAKALNTTDVALLQNPLKGVTSDGATVQKAIAAAGDLSAKIDGLLAANKAVVDFAITLPLDATGAAATAGTLTAGNVKTAVAADILAKAGDVQNVTKGNVAGYVAAATEAEKTALVALAKATNDAAVVVAQTAVADKTKIVTDLGVTAAQLSQFKALVANVTATATAETAALAVQAGAKAKLDTLIDPTGAAKVTIATDGTITGYIKLDTATGKLVVDSAVTDAGKKAAATDLLNSIVAYKAAAANKVAAADAKTQFDAVLNAVDANAVTKIGDITTAETTLTAAQAKNPALDKLVAAYAASKANDTKLVALDKAIADAKLAFTDAGLPLPTEVAGGLTASAGDDTFIVDAAKLGGDIAGFGLLGKDAIYVGKGYELNATGNLTKGNDAKLEVFFKTVAAGTEVYVEQKAFASSEATPGTDLVKITLTGVAADKLVLKDGFIALA